VVFEAGMNWHWVVEILERELSSERIVVANPFETRDAHHCSRRRSRPIGGRADSGRSVTRAVARKFGGQVRARPTGMGPILPALVTQIDGQRLVFREPGSVLHGVSRHRPLMQRARLSNSGENGTSFWLAHWSMKRNLDACVVQKTPLHHGD
jgi:hypothetical protein